MPRYIDADALIKKIFPMGIGDGMYTINAKAVKFAIDNTPTADVAPKSEVERLEKELDSKQFRCDSCDRIMLTGAEHRYCVKQAKAEVAREIFEEIEKEIDSVRGLNFAMQSLDHFIAELKKKYTEEK